MRALDESVALVTGGAAGIGAAVVRRLAGAGTKVVIADVSDAAGSALAEELGGTYVHADISEPGGSLAAVAAAEQAFGGLDIVHLNAGVVSGIRGIDDFSLEGYRRTVGINQDGVVFGIQAAVPALRRRGGGSIVATSSLAGIVASPEDPVYTATKHAVVGYCRALAPALAGDGISLNAVCPGYADTALIQDFKEVFTAANFPVLTPDEVADAVLAILAAGSTGNAWFVQPGRPSAPFRFASVPGPRVGGAPGGAPPPLAGSGG